MASINHNKECIIFEEVKENRQGVRTNETRQSEESGKSGKNNKIGRIKVIDPIEVIDPIAIVETMAKNIWNEHYVPIIGKEQVDYMLEEFQSYEAIVKQIESGYKYFIGSYKGEPAGYFAILPDKDNRKMFLSKLYVDKSYRGHGIAKKAISHIESSCKELGLDIIWLTVNKYNQDSIAAYEKMGFIKEAEIVQDIGRGYVMDDYRMEKRLVI